VDEAPNSGENQELWWITLCFSKYPLTWGYVTYLLILVPESATPTGAVRRGFGPARTVNEAKAESEHGQCLPATSNRAHEHLRVNGSNGESASEQETASASGSDRADRHLRVEEGNGDLFRHSGSQGDLNDRKLRRGNRVRRQLRKTEQWYGAERSGAIPTGLSEDGSDWHQD
jgi:hypothetical protein